MNLVFAAVLCCAGFSVCARDIHEVLDNSEPIEKGTCAIPYHGSTLIVECTRGVRADGTSLYAVYDDGIIVAVYEQKKEGDRPVLIWSYEWQEI